MKFIFHKIDLIIQIIPSFNKLHLNVHTIIMNVIQERREINELNKQTYILYNYFYFKL